MPSHTKISRYLCLLLACTGLTIQLHAQMVRAVKPAALGGAVATLALTSSANPSPFGSSINLTAAVTPATATGTVTFYDGATAIGTATIASGEAAFPTALLPGGVRRLRAVYAGDATYAGAVSSILIQSITTAPGNLMAVKTTLASPSAVRPVTGDFDGDGHTDIAVGSGASVVVFLGAGDGTFGNPTSYAIADGPLSVICGDFNLDGNTDIAATGSSSLLKILLGNGDGTFQAALTSPIRTMFTLAAVADFNLDGKPDLYLNDGVTLDLLAGNGDGTFQAGITYANPGSIDLASGAVIDDFDGDGIPDLAGPNAFNILYTPGRSDGTFGPVSSVGVVNSSSGLISGDVDGDGRVDLLSAGSGGATIQTLFGQAGGTFTAGASIGAVTGVPSSPTPAVAALDFNGDGRLDLAVGGINNLTVLTGNGAGAFQQFPLNTPDYYTYLAAADFNGDGRADFAAMPSAGGIAILLGVAPTLTRTGSPQFAAVGTAFLGPLSVTVYDGATPLPNVRIDFTVLPSSGAGAALSAASVVTDATGTASVAATANGVTGSYIVQASTGSMTMAFSLTNTSPSSGQTVYTVIVSSDPAGLQVRVDGNTFLSPVAYTWTAGSYHKLAAISPQNVDGLAVKFIGWSNGATTPEIDFQASADGTITASFARQYKLTTQASPPSQGSVAADPASSDGTYADGASVALTAIPKDGFTFSNWSGDLTGSDNPAFVLMTQARNVTANFSACTFAISPGAIRISQSGGVGEITITTPAACSWTAWTPTSWIMLPVMTHGTGSGKFRYTISASPDDSVRTGVINVAGQAIEVRQGTPAQPEAQLTLQANPAALGSVTANPSSAGGYYTKGTTVQLTAAAKPGQWFSGWSGDLAGAANPASVTLNSNLSITANFSPCAYTLNPSTILVAAAGGSAVLNVSAPAGCQWTAATNSTWVAIVSGAAGSGNGQVFYSVVPNPDATRRTGSMTIAGSQVSVIQSEPDKPAFVGQGLVNSASYQAGGVAPGELVSILGIALGPATPPNPDVDGDGVYDTNLGGTRVLFSGVPAHLLYAGPNQIVAVVPYSIQGRLDTRVQVEYRGIGSTELDVPVKTVHPGIFTLDQSGAGQAAALNPDGTVNSPGSPAAAGSTVLLYLTGAGPIPGSVEGIVSSVLPTGAPLLLPVQVKIGGVDAPLIYAGAASGASSSVPVISVRVPSGAGSGAVPLVVTVGGVASQNGVTLSVK
jgi:uncharacterized protein (TIGR03437 family)